MPRTKLQKKLIVITGAASGVGRELALKLISKGNTIIGIDVNEEELKLLHTRHKDQFIVFAQDLTQIQDYSAFLNKIQKQFFRRVQCDFAQKNRLDVKAAGRGGRRPQFCGVLCVAVMV